MKRSRHYDWHGENGKIKVWVDVILDRFGTFFEVQAEGWIVGSYDDSAQAVSAARGYVMSNYADELRRMTIQKQAEEVGE